MYVQSLHIAGLADLPELRLTELDRVVHILGPSPSATAVGDGLALASAAMSETALRSLLSRWGLLQPGEDVEIQTNPLPVQACWEDRQMARFLVADPSERRVQVDLELVPDPPLFAELRSLGARAPRLATALSADAVLQISVSAFLAASWDVLSISVQSFSVGGESFPTTGKERPGWLTALLAQVGGRFWHHTSAGQAAEVAMAAMTSPHPEDHANLEGWQEALRPVLGPVRPVRGPANIPMLLAGNHPLRRFGRFGADRADLAASIFLSGADVLWVGFADDWADGFVEGEGSPLEQIWRVTPEEGLDPGEGAHAAPRSVLSFSAATDEE